MSIVNVGSKIDAALSHQAYGYQKIAIVLFDTFGFGICNLPLSLVF